MGEDIRAKIVEDSPGENPGKKARENPCSGEPAASLALAAARIRIDLAIPMADSVLLATARAQRAVLWSQDSGFEGIAGVKYVARSR